MVVLGVLASCLAGGYADRLGQRESQALLERRVERAGDALHQEVLRYQDTVSLLASSLGAQQDFTVTDFDAVSAPLRQARLAGASGAVFVAAAGPEQAGAASSFWQARGSVPLVPAGSGEHFFVVFSRGLDDASTTSRGRDLALAPQPARALAEARATGAVTVSDTYLFLRDRELPKAQQQPAIVIAAPVYGAPGTTQAGQVRGWAMMGMRTGDAARAVLDDAARGAINVSLSITDSTGVAKKAATVAGGPAAVDGRTSKAGFVIGDQTWQLSASSTVAGDEVSTTYSRLGWVLVLGGSALSVLLGGICWLLVSGRRRALAAVAAATAELRATGVELAAAEVAARNQAGLMNAIVDSIGDGVSVVDAQGQFLLRNRAAAALLAVGECLGAPGGEQGHQRMYLADGRTLFPVEELPLARAMRGQSADEVDIVIRDPARPEGAIITMSARPLDPAAGVPGGAVAIFRDVTERRRADQALERSETAYALAFEGSMVGMSVTTVRGVFLRVNQALADIVGCTREHLVGRSAAEINHSDDDVASTLELIAEVVAGRREGFRQRKRLVRSDGATVHVDMSSVLVRDLDGTPLHFTNQVIDITHQVQAEAERDARQQMLRAVMDNSQSLIAVKDLDRRYLLANTPLQRTAGRSEQDIIGRLEADVFPHVDAVRQERDLAARTGVRYEEDVITRPDGTQVVYETARFPLFDAAGTVYATCSMSTDVTAKRRAAADREEAAAAVAVAATEASTAKSVLLATMSHEIRTPLNGVLGLLTLLQETRLDARQQTWAHAAVTSGRALLAIVNDVLDASKIEAGAVVLESIELDVLAVVEEAVCALRTIAADKGVHLVTTPARGLTSARVGDPTRLRQIITNLVANAVKFTDHGTVTVIVAGSDRRVQVVVADTGIGMSPAQQEHLFTPYAQAEASTARTFGGTGLGLSIVAGTVKAMNGTITATSAPARGTTFEVDLPMLAVTSRPTPPAARPRRAQAPTTRALRVLVAEDNEVNQMVATATLQRQGLLVDVVADGAAAIEAVMAGGYDAVFMDCQMPHVDGLEATRRIRALESAERAGRQIPIIAMTASAFDTDRAACRQAGMDAFLPKPWTHDQLLESLTLLRSSARDAPPRALSAPAAAVAGGHDGAGDVQDVLARLDELFEDTDPIAAAPLRRRLVDSFLRRTPPMLAELTDAAAHHDQASLVRVAHSLRGMAGNLGATDLAGLAGLLEQLAGPPGTTPTGAGELVTALHAAFDLLAADLGLHTSP